MQEKIEILTTYIASLQSQNNMMILERQTIYKQIQKLRSQVSKNDQLYMINRNLKKQNQSLILKLKNKSKSKQKRKEQSNKLEEAYQQIQQLRKALTQVQSFVVILQNELKMKQQQLKLSRDKNQKLKQQNLDKLSINFQSQFLKNILQQLKEKDAELKYVYSQLKTFKNKINDQKLKTKNTNQKQQNKLIKILKNKQKQCEYLQSKIHILTQNYQIIESQLLQKDQKIDQLYNQIQNLKIQCYYLNQQLNKDNVRNHRSQSQTQGSNVNIRKSDLIKQNNVLIQKILQIQSEDRQNFYNFRFVPGKNHNSLHDIKNEFNILLNTIKI